MWVRLLPEALSYLVAQSERNLRKQIPFAHRPLKLRGSDSGLAQRTRPALVEARTLDADADVAQTEEHRSATPGRPVRSGSSALEGLWCKRQHGELQPRRSGFDPWQACLLTIVAGRSGSVIW